MTKLSTAPIFALPVCLLLAGMPVQAAPITYQATNLSGLQSDFTFTGDDISGDDLLQNDEITAFSGMTIFNPGTTYEILHPADHPFPDFDFDINTLTWGNNQINFKDTSSGNFIAFAADQVWSFTVVPVPAAAWLFVSALGLLGLMRRKVK